MLNWLPGKPKCPVDPDCKQWIESRFTWLTQELGMDRLEHGETVLPTSEFFPNPYEPTEDGVLDLMDRVAALMDIDPATLTLSFYQDTEPHYEGETRNGTAGMYTQSQDQFEISLEVTSIGHAVEVVATLAHEIGHVVLLGQNRINPDVEDHEELTDLLTVFLGFGVYTSYSVVRDVGWSDGQWAGWSVGKRGYMSMNMYGYALALYALARYEPKPHWLTYLRPDVRASFKRGVRYITSTNDCEFLPACRS